MTNLADSKCVPCRGGVPVMSDFDIALHLPEVPGWRVAEVDGIKRIVREFGFPDFRRAMEFAVKVGDLAEDEGHHPDLHVSWGKCVVATWTHKIKGLHRNDFILAAKTNRIYEGLGTA